jgi:photosystem II stability/assembly factor-like uncharacterized protein
MAANEKAAVILATTDGGNSWSVQPTPAGIGGLQAVSCPTVAVCFAAGITPGLDGGVVIGTNNGGSSWQEEFSTNEIGIFSGISCPTTSNCFVVGYSGFNQLSMIVATTDGGTTWTSQAVPDNQSNSGPVLDAISCPSATVCFAASELVPSFAPSGNDAILSTTDGGAKWVYQAVPGSTTPILLAISCPSISVCFASGYGAVGSNGTTSAAILSTTDGGSTWVDDAVPSSVNLVPGVNCPAVSACFATAYSTKSDGAGITGAVLTDTVLGPTITSVLPASSSLQGGGTITILGSDLSGATGVYFGTTAATNFKVVSTTELTATVPPSTTAGWVAVTVTTPQGTTPVTPSTGFVYVDSGLQYVPLSPYRILDTRCTVSPQPSYCPSENLPAANASLGPPAATGFIDVQVTGTGQGSDSVPTSAESVVLNVTGITSPVAHPGYLTIYPASTSTPLASSLNYQPSDVVANLVTVTIGAKGMISVFSNSGGANVAMDVEGYYVSNSTAGLTYTPVLPTRILDTRCAEPSPPPGITGSYCNSLPPVNSVVDAPGQNGYRDFQVSGYGAIPISATAVTLNVTAVDPTAAGYLSVLPEIPQSPPTSSNVNFAKGQTAANAVTVPLSSGVSGGGLTVYNYSGTTQVVIDVSGYFSSSTTGLAFTPSSPVRICDTRPSSISGITDQCTGETLPASGGSITVQVTHEGTVPASALAMVANVTVDSVSPGSGYLTVWPGGAATGRPAVSNINWVAPGQIRPNMATVELSSTGTVDVYASTGANVIVDIVGWYT